MLQVDLLRGSVIVKALIAVSNIGLADLENDVVHYTNRRCNMQGDQDM